VLCFRCGVCCTRYQVRLDQVEAMKIADKLGMAWDEWLSRYADHSWPGTRSFLLARSEAGCVFLEQTKRNKTGFCLIQAFKPSACEEWSASLDRRECQEGLGKYWGLKVNSCGEPEGPERKLREFDAFVKLLECSDAPGMEHQVSGAGMGARLQKQARVV
jgi:Fe-S-cluster containining protein